MPSEAGCARVELGIAGQDDDVNTAFNNPATFTFSPADQFIVTLQVQDPDSIKEMDVSGSGTFQCSYIDPKLVTHPCGSVTSNLIPKQTTTIGSSGSYQGFVMSLPFRYYDIPCGTYDNQHSCQAYSGTLHVQGNETSWLGANTGATLDLSPI